MGRLPSKIVMLRGKEYLTRLGAEMRVDRDSPPIEARGSINELNCWIGVIMTLSSSTLVKQTLNLVQHDLCYLCDQISVPETSLLSLEHVARIDSAVERIATEHGGINEGLNLPGGVPSGAFSHVAHAVCQRAQRRLCSLMQSDSRVEGFDGWKERKDFGIAYLGRLSDLLLAIAHLENDKPNGSNFKQNSEIA